MITLVLTICLHFSFVEVIRDLCAVFEENKYMSYGEKVVDFVGEVVKEYGPRLAGSEAELRAGERIYKLMFEFCNEVRKDWFVSRPRGFTNYIWVVFFLYILGATFYFTGLWFAIFALTPRIVDIRSPAVLTL